MDAQLGGLGPMLQAQGFVEITPADGVLIDLRYATTANIFGEALYQEFDRLFLHPIAAEKLRVAVAALARCKPDARLLVFDGLRPNRVQRRMWEAVRGTNRQIYVGDPSVGSIHGFGMAVDLTLATPNGREFDMGTPFDDFSPLAEPRLEPEHQAKGLLTPAQIANRILLRRVMTEAGFRELPIEWWHFDALPADTVRAVFPLVE